LIVKEKEVRIKRRADLYKAMEKAVNGEYAEGIRDNEQRP